ncbi:MAG: hypothetical protein AAF459_12800 [Pseudomonadota bacterium]
MCCGMVAACLDTAAEYGLSLRTFGATVICWPPRLWHKHYCK